MTKTIFILLAVWLPCIVQAQNYEPVAKTVVTDVEVQEAGLQIRPNRSAGRGDAKELTATEKVYMGIAIVVATVFIGYRVIQRKSASDEQREDWTSKD